MQRVLYKPLTGPRVGLAACEVGGSWAGSAVTSAGAASAVTSGRQSLAFRMSDLFSPA